MQAFWGNRGKELPHRTLVGEPLSALGIGCSRVGSLNNLTPLEEIRATLFNALDFNINVFDTADAYGQGDSERVLGTLFAALRSHVFVITKIGLIVSTKAKLVRPLKPLLRFALRASPRLQRKAVAVRQQASGAKDFSLPYLEGAIQASLARFRWGIIDGLLLHNPPAAVLRQPEIALFLEDLLALGYARYVGASVETIEEVAAAMQINCLSLLQIPLHLIEPLTASPLANALVDKKIAVFAREIMRGKTVFEAVPPVLGVPFVSSVLVGVSSRPHLRDLVKAAS